MDSKRGGRVIYAGTNAVPTNLNPMISTSFADAHGFNFIFDGLTSLDEQLAPQAALAESWVVSDDGLVWTIRLRDNVKWHDDQPFTAEDVKFTFDTAMNPDIGSPHNSVLTEFVSSVEIVDPLTIEIATSKPWGPFLSYMGDWLGLKIVPKHLLEGETNLAESNFNRDPIGTGPFKFREWSTDDVITLERFDDYWGGSHPNTPGTPYIDEWIIKAVEDPNALNAQLTTGEVTIGVVRQTDYEAMKDVPNVVLHRTPGTIQNYLAVNHNKPLFQDSRVRQALMYAIDRQGIVGAVLQDQGGVADSVYFPTSWAYDPAQEDRYPYDPEQASQLLAEAGWDEKDADGILVKDGERFEFILKQYSEWEPFVQSAQIIQANLGDVGIKVDLEMSDFNTWFANTVQAGDFDAYIFAFLSADPDLSSNLACEQVPPIGANYYGYCNEEVDVILRQAAETADTEERKKLYFDLQRILAEDVPVVTLNWQQNIVGVSENLKGFRQNAEWSFPFAYSIWLEE